MLAGGSRIAVLMPKGFVVSWDGCKRGMQGAGVCSAVSQAPGAAALLLWGSKHKT